MPIMWNLCAVLGLLLAVQSSPPRLQRNLTVQLVRYQPDYLSQELANMAADIVNVELAKSGYALRVETLIARVSEKLNGTALKDGVVAVIDITDREQMKVISRACEERGVPHLPAYGNTYSSFFPTDMDLVVYPGIEEFLTSFGQLLRYMQKKPVNTACLSSTDFAVLCPALSTDLSMRWIEWNPNTADSNYNVPSQLGGMRYVIVDMPYWQVTDFMKLIHARNLTSNGTVFILTDWDSNHRGLPETHLFGEATITVSSMVYKRLGKQKSDRGEVQTEFKFIGNMNAGVIFNKTEEEIYLMPRHSFLLESMNLVSEALRLLARTNTIKGYSRGTRESVLWPLGRPLLNRMMDISKGRSAVDLFKEKSLVLGPNLALLEVKQNGFVEFPFSMDEKQRIARTRARRSNSDGTTRTLKVTTILTKPFVLYKGRNFPVESYDSNINNWDGFCIDLLREIGKDLNIVFSMQVVRDGKYGQALTLPNGMPGWNGMVGEVMTGRADMIMAPLTITYDREKVIDFTTPFMSFKLCVIISRPPETASFSYIWVFIVLLYIGLGLGVCFISHFIPFERIAHSPADDTTKPTPRHGWFRLVPVHGKGICPQLGSMRTIAIAWWILSAVIICAYVICLTAYWKGSRISMPVQTVEDLAKQTTIKYGTIKGGSSQAFFEKSPIQLYQRMYRNMINNPDASFVSSTEEGIERVRNSKGNYAFILESNMAEYYTFRDCSLVHLADLMESRGYGIGLPNGSPLRENLTMAINKLQNTQTIQLLGYKWWQEINATQTKCAPKSKSKDEYLVFGIGLLITAFLASVELYLLFQHKKRNLNAQFHKYLSSELHSVLHADKDAQKTSANDTVTFKYTIGDPNSPMCLVTGKTGHTMEVKDN